MKVLLERISVMILLCLSIYGCRKNSVDESEGLVIIDVADQIGNYQVVPASEYISKLEYIPLETNDSCIMGKINRIYIDATHIIIVGYNNRSFCYAFTRDGKFLGEIGRYGQGPAEYNIIYNISIDDKEQVIYLSTRNKILKYTLNGEFLRSIKIPQIGAYIDNFIFLRDNLFIGHVCNDTGQENYNFIIFNDSAEIIKSFYNYIKFEKVATHFNVVSIFSMEPYKVAQNLYLKELSNDTLYCLNEQNNLIPQFYFELDKYIFPIHLRQIGGTVEFKDLIAIPKNTKPIVGTDDCIFFSLSAGANIPKPKGLVRTIPAWGGGTIDLEDNQPVGIFDITKNRTRLLDTDPVSSMVGLINDLDGGLSFWPIHYTSDNELVDIWQTYDMKGFLTDEYFNAHQIKDPTAHQRLKAIVKKLKDDDNPVIVIAKLK
jgi:hypothetical protein